MYSGQLACACLSDQLKLTFNEQASIHCAGFIGSGSGNRKSVDMRKNLFACASAVLLAGLTLGMSVMLFVMESQGNGVPGGSVVLAV